MMKCYQAMFYQVETVCKVKRMAAGGVYPPVSGGGRLLHLLPSTTDRWQLPYNHSLPIRFKQFVVNQYFLKHFVNIILVLPLGAHVGCQGYKHVVLLNVRSPWEGQAWHCLTDFES